MFLCKEKIVETYDSLMVSRPLFERSNIEYYRKERKGFATCIPRGFAFSNYLLINPTASLVLKNCDGQKTVKMIYKDLCNIFTDVRKKQIEEDLINVLYDFTKYNLLKWTGGSEPFMYDNIQMITDNISINTAKEGDIRKIYNFIKDIFSEAKTTNDMLVYTNPNKFMGEYVNEVLLRHKLFNFLEEFFVIEKDGRVYNIISIIIPKISSNTAAEIGIMLLDIKFADQIMEYVVSNIRQITTHYITKVKLKLLEDSEDSKLIGDIFSRMGFIKEGILKNEIGRKSEIIYSYFLE
ncbi:PqqD family protein [Thermoanaerobacterium thermosaccharolyticum]|uniref:PqqD family protein n=1 Tax=Thermoanaerobacterium thermosaccharolyticum TaxID=1517 RepID=UPI002FDA41FD